MPARPTKPVPKSNMVAGSGTGAGEILASKDVTWPTDVWVMSATIANANGLPGLPEKLSVPLKAGVEKGPRLLISVNVFSNPVVEPSPLTSRLTDPVPSLK